MSNETKKLSWILSVNGVEFLRQIIIQWDALCIGSSTTVLGESSSGSVYDIGHLLPQVSRVLLLSLRHFATAGPDAQAVQLHLLIHMYNCPGHKFITNWADVVHIPITGLQSGSVKVRQLSLTTLLNFCLEAENPTLSSCFPGAVHPIPSLKSTVRSIMVDTISYLLIIRSPRVHSLRQAFCAVFGK